MKKILPAAVVTALILTMTACSDKPSVSDGSSEYSTVTTTQSSSSSMEEVGTIQTPFIVLDGFWDKYVSQTPKTLLSEDEKVLYERVEECCKPYLYGFDKDFSYTKVIEKKTGKENYMYLCEGIKVDDLNLSEKEMNKVYELFKLNSPQYYFLDKGHFFNEDNGSYYFSCIAPDNDIDFTKGKSRNVYTEKLYKKIREVIDSIDPNLSDVQKTARAADIICGLAVADDNSSFKDSAYGTLLLGGAMCQGYSGTFALIMNGLGVDTFQVLNAEDNHTWNMSKIGDKYYMHDIANLDTHTTDRDRYLNVSYQTILTRNSETLSYNLNGTFSENALKLASETDYPEKY